MRPPCWGREWWNAGVEGFGTRQEMLFYARFNRPLRPDHVVLTIHNNDLTPTPIVFFDEDGRLDKVVAAHDVTNRGVRLLCSAFDEAAYRAEEEARRRAEVRRAIDPKTRAIDANANADADEDGSTRRLPSSENMSDVREAIEAFLREDGGPRVGDDAGLYQPE